MSVIAWLRKPSRLLSHLGFRVVDYFRVAALTKRESPQNIAPHWNQVGAISNGSSLLKHGASKNRTPAQGGVEGIGRYRGHEKDCRKTDARIPRRTLSR
jgi:hypothetical protein